MMEQTRPWREQEQARTLEAGRELMRRWRESGQSAQEFCREHGIPSQRLGYWRSRLGENGVKEAGPQFVAVRVREAASEAAIQVVLRSGRLVRVHGAVDSETVRAVIEAAEAAC